MPISPFANAEGDNIAKMPIAEYKTRHEYEKPLTDEIIVLPPNILRLPIWIVDDQRLLVTVVRNTNGVPISRIRKICKKNAKERRISILPNWTYYQVDVRQRNHLDYTESFWVRSKILFGS